MTGLFKRAGESFLWYVGLLVIFSKSVSGANTIRNVFRPQRVMNFEINLSDWSLH